METLIKAAAEIRKTIFSLIPPSVEITKVDFEGPKIAIYTRKPQLFIENNGELIKKVAKAVKKRVIVRGDPQSRMSEKDAQEYIISIIPKEAGLKDIYFNLVTGEVELELLYPEKVSSEILYQILSKTLWHPKLIRKPPISSRTIREIRELYRSYSAERLKFLHELGYRIYRKPLFETKYVRITALGSFREVGRSAILIQTPESNILLDAGIKPTSNGDELPYFDLPEFDISNLDAVIITHAHLDHCGILPYLFKYGYKGPVYMTEPTLHLSKLLYEDYIKIAEREGRKAPYTMRDVASTILHTYTLGYNEVTDIAPDARLTFYRSGHILGSALAHIHIGDGLINIVYTGDIKYAKTVLLDPAYTRFPRVEVLIIESTYGGHNDNLPNEMEAQMQLSEIVLNTIRKNGIVLIPVLAIGRAQEILLTLLDHIKKKILPEIPIFIEGMIDEVSAVHTAYPEYLSQRIREMIYNGENPFTMSNVHIVKGEDREEIVNERPAVILATSGMLTGGPVLDYLKLLASDENSSLVFVSYQVEGTLGRKILQGLRKLTFTDIQGKMIVKELKMSVYRVEGFSGHSDRRQLSRYLRHISPTPKVIILNHGEKTKISEFKGFIEGYLKKKFNLNFEVLAPKNMETVRLH
ncbi:MAG: beta-CASP ribonuclease aCPSF1 [Thermoprotei archaeon]|nr:MAG: beta-CASP ribonuclease aCPSF1 [Thermoprotei archaeon]